MTRFWVAAALLLALFLALFLLVERLGVPLLTDPAPWMGRADTLAALLGVSLLALDVALPVPSSLVMMLHGALFGVVGGTLLSVAGSTSATLLGFALGRRGGRLFARLVAREERARAERLLRRYGAPAIIVTRPVPLLAETVAVLAGASALGWRHATLAAVVGALPPALLYALAGAVATDLRDGALLGGLALLAAALCWLLMRRVKPC